MNKTIYFYDKSLLKTLFCGQIGFYTIIGSSNGMIDAHALRGGNLPTLRHSHPFIGMVWFAGKKQQESFKSMPAW